jgi:hypothetical protein
MRDRRGHAVASTATAAFTRGELSMRFGTKAAIMTAFAGPAIAALMLTGAGPANAAVTTTTSHTTSTSGWFNPFCFNQFQNPFNQRQQWNLSGSNTVDLWYNGTEYTYGVQFNQRGSCLTGTLTDLGLPSGEQTGPIHGTIFGNHVTFSFRYPTSFQGTRTFNGYINRWGDVSGNWSETGSENGSGHWSLARNAHRACHRFMWWSPNQACFLF